MDKHQPKNVESPFGAAPCSLFWRSKGSRKLLKVTTERGHKDTGCYIWKVWPHQPNEGWTAHAPGGRSLGRFLSEVSAQVEVEKFYLANAQIEARDE